MSDASNLTSAAVRVDVWLWAARFFKTRSLAKQAIEGGKVRLNDEACKPAKTVCAGDRLRITRGEERLEVEVVALSEQRGPASAAQQLYRESEASAAARAAQREMRRLEGGGLRPPSRPDKKARRQLREWKDAGRS
ncbi:RNA-binding S4 domain-containing protein [Frateuria defendens]|uniref:RNA-binding S4 domain-containing protein n=1 Tax=Frateuria defendens TaxID=2219559 RepID=UPI00066FB36C|nr:RNA-binding S4 domain-containing protein [Frateuria defendens]